MNQLEVFATVAREGSFTRAGRSLLRSEAAVSQQVKLLEETVGARLLERVPGRVIRLTEAGRRLLSTCESVLQSLEGTLEDLDELRRSEQGNVVLGAGAYFGSYLLPPIYASFQQRAPGITTLLYIANTARCVEALRRREVDLAVVGGDIEVAGIDGTCLAEKDLVWIGRPDHQLASRSVIPFSLIAADRLILTPGRTPKRQSLERMAQDAGLTLRANLEIRGVEAQVTAVRAGFGLAAVPYHVMSHYDSATLRALPVEGFPLRLNWCLLWRAEELSAAAATLRDHLLAQRSQIEMVSLCAPDLAKRAIA